ncbi:hypothetical protein [Hyphomicrobium sp. 99]|uniref:hypothetical protein n=1 Tax=Hyphomicrobium sp. 99 TaxID=1163419 RepID=UPI0005F8659A|nr:hypothetical protein [Hyphomicrobium sp. 99]
MLEGSQRPLTKPQWCAALAWASLAALTVGLVSASAEETDKAQKAPEQIQANPAAESAPPAMALETFLDRLMMAESSGQNTARNPGSTAVGPFQFIQETFLDIVRRHFAEETISLSAVALLALRQDRAFARRAAEAYTKDNSAHLAREGLATSFINLRLAYLAGPSGAVRVLRALPETKVSVLLSSSAISANTFLAQMTAQELITKCARDLNVDPASVAGVAADSSPGAQSGRPKIDVKCNQKLPSCRRWVALRLAQPDRKLGRSQGRSSAHSAQR